MMPQTVEKLKQLLIEKLITSMSLSVINKESGLKSMLNNS